MYVRLTHDVCVLQAKQEAEQQAASARAEAEAARSETAQLQTLSQTAQGAEAAVHRLVELIYFATVSLQHTYNPQHTAVTEATPMPLWKLLPCHASA